MQMRSHSLKRAFDRIGLAWAKNPPALRFAIVVSAYWLVGFTLYAAWSRHQLVALPPNSVGDFLAGAFAPLAFLWLVITVLLQKDELGLQREELRQSRLALEAQATETRALVEQNKRSVEVAFDNLQLQQAGKTEDRLIAEMEDLQFRFEPLGERYRLIHVNDNHRVRLLLTASELRGPSIDVIKDIIRALKWAAPHLRDGTYRVSDPQAIKDVEALIGLINRLVGDAQPHAAARRLSSSLNLNGLLSALNDLADALLESS